MLKQLRIILFLMPALFLAACATDGCYEDLESYLMLSVSETDAEEEIDIDSLTVYGLGLGDLKLYEMAELNSMKLPLNGASSSSAFIIVNGTSTDTLTIYYSSYHNFVSQGCGYNYLYTLESIEYTRNRIDTVLIINENVSTADEENLRAFF